jgi:hypothetical protein
MSDRLAGGFGVTPNGISPYERRVYKMALSFMKNAVQAITSCASILSRQTVEAEI